MNSLVSFLADVWFAAGIHLWQTALVFLPVLVLARWVRFAPARALDVLWGLALLKLLIPTAVVGKIINLPASLTSLLARLGLAPMPDADTWVRIVDPSLLVTAAPDRNSPLLSAVLLVLTAWWVIVVAGSLLRSGKELRRQAPGNAVSAALEPALQLRLERAAAAAGISLRHLVVRDEATLPYAAGLIRPRLHIPSHLVRVLTAEELEAVLLHERAHAVRRDPLRRALYRGLDTVLFFYPVWWLLRNKLEESAELVCDEFVLRAGISPGSYRKALARCLRSNFWGVRPSFAAAMAERAFLKHRLASLARAGRFSLMSRSGIVLVSAFTLIVAGSLAPIVITGCASESERAAETKAPVVSEPPAATPEMQELDQMPELIQMGKVEYPESARKAGVEGMVLIKARVTVEGRVAEAAVESGVDDHPELGESALAAVREATFRPGMRDGKPVESWVKIPVKFALK